MKIFIATKNRDKIIEIKEIFKHDKEFEFLSINNGINIPDVIEDGNSFEENSQKKALEISKYLNMPVISDDSGFCVGALNDAPGIYSARYAGLNATYKLNRDKLLEEMKNINKRDAKLVCVASFASFVGEVFSSYGELKGEVSYIDQGNNGFGYDSIFYIKEYKKTLAELGQSFKNNISHRKKAFEELKLKIKIYFNL